MKYFLVVWTIIFSVHQSQCCNAGDGYFGWVCNTTTGCFCKQGQICQKTLSPNCPGHCVDNPWGIGCVDEKRNLAFGKPTAQSSNHTNGYPSLAVDGNNSTDVAVCARTNQENNPWWQVDLGGLYVIRTVAVIKPNACQPNSDIKMYIGNDTTQQGNTQLQNLCSFEQLVDLQAPARFVKFSKSGSQSLQLCEVIVRGYTYPYNIAFGKTASQSSAINHTPGVLPGYAIDGDTNTYFPHGSCSHTETEHNPWWEVDLGDTYLIYSVTLVNRDAPSGDRLKNITIEAKLPNSTAHHCASREESVPSGEALEMPCDITPAVGKVVRVSLKNDTYKGPLTLCEVIIKGYRYQDCNNWKFVPECRYGCNCRNTAEVCDRRTPTCTSGCADGWRKVEDVCQEARPYFVMPPTVSSRTENSVSISWESWSQGSYPGVGSVHSYVAKAWQGNTIESTKTSAANATSATLENLLEYTEYNFTVSVKDNENQEGKPSPCKTNRTCGVPIMVMLSSLSPSLTESWIAAKIELKTRGMTEAVHRCDGFEKLNLFVKGEYGDNVTKEVRDVKESQDVLIENLVPFSNYTISISAVNNLNLEGPVLMISERTPEGVPPKMVPPTVTNRSHDTIQLSWEAPRPPGGIITEYKISYGLGDNYWNESIVNAGTYRKSVDNLMYNTTYMFRICARTNIGYGEYSDSVPADTIEGKPEPPTKFTNTSRSDTSLEFSWNEPLIRNGKITGYKIECSVDGKNLSEELLMSARTVVLSKLKSGTKYICGLMAKTSVGYGVPSKVITWTKPSVPNDIEVTPVSQSILQRTISSITVKLPVKHYGEMYKYRIVVEKEIKERRRRRASDLNDAKIQRLVPCQSVTDTDQLLCVAAELGAGDLGKPFTVGDNKTYGGYYNRPLEEGKSYNIYFGPAQTVDGITAQFYVAVVKGFIPQQDDKNPDIAGAVGGVVAAVLVVAGLAIAVWIYMRRQRLGRKNPDSTPEPRMSFMELEKRVKDNEPSERPLSENSYMDNTQEPLYGNVEQGTDIPVGEIFAIMKTKSRDTLKAEYEKFPTAFTAKCIVGQKPENHTKNRFKNIMAYDHSRIALTPLPDDPHSDYINANYIDSYKKSKAFIAAQGPKPNTVNDFWRMVWQEHSPLIVMVTNLAENGKAKCAKYWPDKGNERFGIVSVTLKKKESHPDFTVRTLLMSVSNSPTKTVKQFHFTGWPDHGVPVDASALVRFREEVKSYQRKVEGRGPTIVHCSAGVGRTGTFIALDYLLDQAEAEGKINIFNLVQQMRGSRPMMIQTEEQYYFVHDVMLEELFCGTTTIPVQELQPYLHRLDQVDSKSGLSKLEGEFAVLQYMFVGSDDTNKAALDPANVNKNRVRNITPANGCRPYLSTPVDGGTDYINAVFIDGYRQGDAYIVTQMPLPDTVVDFWRMMYDHNSATIVMMNEGTKMDKTAAVYWPESGSATYGPFTVEVVSTYKSGDSCIVKEFELKNIKRTKEEPRKIRQFQLQGWKTSDPTPSSTEELLELLDEVQHWQQQSGNTTITVHCMNGAHQSGVFCAVSRILEKMKVEQQVDVFHTVKAVRINRPQFIDSLAQYEFCYTAVEEYARRFDTYANFQI